MVLKAKAPKRSIDEIINKGGKTKEDTGNDEVVKFTMILPKRLADMIDENRKSRLSPMTRRGWIIEACIKALAKG